MYFKLTEQVSITEVIRARREKQNGHRGEIVWFTGLSRSGKSALAHSIGVALHQQGVLEGKNLRHGVCGDLFFSEKDRKENLWRIAEMSKLLIELGVMGLAAIIKLIAQIVIVCAAWLINAVLLKFTEIPLLKFAKRTTLIAFTKKNRADEISKLIGTSSPHEIPESPELVLNTGTDSLGLYVQQTTTSTLRLGIFTCAHLIQASKAKNSIKKT